MNTSQLAHMHREERSQGLTSGIHRASLSAALIRGPTRFLVKGVLALATTLLAILKANAVTIGALWDAQKVATILRIFVGMSAVIVPVLSWCGSSFMIDALSSKSGIHMLWTGAGLYVAASIALGVIPVALSSLERMSDNRTFELVFSKYTRKMVTFTLEQLSEPELSERAKQVRERAVWRMMSMARLMPQMIRSIGMLMVSMYIVGWYNPVFVLILIGVAIPTVVLEIRHAKRRAETEERLAPVWGNLWGDLHNLTVPPSLSMLHQFGAALWFAARYRRLLGEASAEECKLEVEAALGRSCAALLVGIGTAWCVWSLCEATLEGAISVGAFILALGAVSSLSVGFSEFASLMGQQWSQSKSIADLLMLLEHEHSPRVTTRAVSMQVEYGNAVNQIPETSSVEFALPVELEFEDVWYQYPGAKADQFAANGLSFVVPRGAVVAVVGPNGAGKSSMMSLLSRQLRAQRGEIRIDGKPISKMTEEAFARRVVMLPQRLNHFNLPVRELLNLGRATNPASPDLLWQELERVGAADFVRSWKYGLDTPLGLDRREATEPSGGQLQRLLLAAVVLANRGLIVLDEPVSMVDPESAKRFWDAMFAEVTDRTLIFSTHHLGAVRRADSILYIEDGRVAVQGKHDDLMEVSQKYRDLFEAQAGEYR